MKKNLSVIFMFSALGVLSLVNCAGANPDTTDQSANHSATTPITFSGNPGSGDPVYPDPAPVITVPAIVQNLNLVTSNSNDQLSDWPSQNVLDQNPSSCYSSTAHPADYNAFQNGITLAAWAAGPVTISGVQLQARVVNGQVQGFPGTYRLFLTKPDNSGWDYLGESTTQPDGNGVLNIATGTRQTYGVLIIPQSLGVDGYGVHYFQLCGIRLLQ